MTHKVTVRFGGAADSEVHDYSDRVHLLGDGSPLIYGGMACDNGSAGMGQLILDDEDNDIPHRTDPPGLQLAAHNQLIWSEDSPGYESWLSIGRIDNKSVGRPYTRTAGVNRQWTVQWADANIDFDGLTLTEDWVRPAETAAERVVAAVAAFCNGSPRLTTVFETHLVDMANSAPMPAKTYSAGTELPELFDDCASVDGRVYSVVIHDQDSASHTCLLYIDEEDHTTYACTLSISDQLDEVDGETVFEPVWRQGGATEEQGQELITGLVSRYGLDTSATVVVTDSDHADSYDYWVKPYNDDLAATATEATNRATAMVHSRWNEHVTHQPSILIQARLHHLLKAGMSIDIKSAAAMGGQYLNTVQTRRIANIEWSHAGWRGDDAMLWANLQLDRTPRKLPLSIGTKPGPKPAQDCSSDVTVAEVYSGEGSEELTDFTVPSPTDRQALIAVSCLRDTAARAAYTYDYDSTSGVNDTQDFTLIASVDDAFETIGEPNRLEMHALLDPTPTVGTGSIHREVTGTVADAATWTVLRLSGVPIGATIDDLATVVESANVAGTGAAISDAIVGADGAQILSVVGYKANNTTATPGAGLTTISDKHGFFGNGDPIGAHYVAKRTGTGASVTNSWTLSAAPDEDGIIELDVAFAGCAPDIPPASDDSTGAVGTCTDYARCDHKHPVQTAADTPITDTAGDFTATDVEAALAELQSDAEAHLGDTSDAHDASAVSVLDTAANFTGTDVEAVLAELQDNIDGVTAGSSAHTHVWNEEPAGTVDGTNDTFTLDFIPDPTASLMVFVDGLLMTETVDFTLSGDDIIFGAGSIPASGAVIRASYIGDTPGDGPPVSGSLYADVVLADSPVHRWRMNDTAGPLVDDIAANNAAVTPTLTFSAAGATGDGDTAISNAASGYATPGYGSIPVGTNAWSVEALVKSTATGKQMIASYGTGGTRAALFFCLNGNASPQLSVHSWADDRDISAPGLLDGNWHHVVFTHAASSSTVKVYMDGALLGTLTYGGALNTGTGMTPRIAANCYDLGSRLNGSIDELAVYAAELTSTQVSDHYAAIGNS